MSKPSLAKAAVAIGVVVVVIIIGFLPIIPTRRTFNDVESFEREVRFNAPSPELRMGFDILGGLGDITVVTQSVTNVDTEGGTFRVEASLFTVSGLFGIRSDDAFISPGQSRTFEFEFDTELGQDVRAEIVIIPSNTITQRIRERTETLNRSLFDILLNP